MRHTRRAASTAGADSHSSPLSLLHCALKRAHQLPTHGSAAAQLAGVMMWELYTRADSRQTGAARSRGGTQAVGLRQAVPDFVSTGPLTLRDSKLALDNLQRWARSIARLQMIQRSPIQAPRLAAPVTPNPRRPRRIPWLCPGGLCRAGGRLLRAGPRGTAPVCRNRAAPGRPRSRARRARSGRVSLALGGAAVPPGSAPQGSWSRQGHALRGPRWQARWRQHAQHAIQFCCFRLCKPDI